MTARGKRLQEMIHQLGKPRIGFRFETLKTVGSTLFTARCRLGTVNGRLPSVCCPTRGTRAAAKRAAAKRAARCRQPTARCFPTVRLGRRSVGRHGSLFVFLDGNSL
jgi:hypothetical protein